MYTKESVIRKEIFGSAVQPISVSELSRRTGIPKSTLYKYREDPERIPLGCLLTIWKATGKSGEDFKKLL